MRHPQYNSVYNTSVLCHKFMFIHDLVVVWSYLRHQQKQSMIFSQVTRIPESRGPAAKCDDNLLQTIEIAVHLLEMVRTIPTAVSSTWVSLLALKRSKRYRCIQFNAKIYFDVIFEFKNEQNI